MTDEIIIGGDSADIPNGTYPAKLSGVTTKTSDAFGDFRAWDFTTEEGSRVGGATSMNTGSKSKGGKWIAALLGRKPEKGEKVSAEIMGKPCLIVVEQDKNDWPKVMDVLPPMKGGKKPSQTAQDAPGREDEAGVASEPTALDF